MKNKTFTNDQLIQAADIIQAFYTKLAEKYANSNTSESYNNIRLEMKNLKKALGAE